MDIETFFKENYKKEERGVKRKPLLFEVAFGEHKGKKYVVPFLNYLDVTIGMCLSQYICRHLKGGLKYYKNYIVTRLDNIPKGIPLMTLEVYRKVTIQAIFNDKDRITFKFLDGKLKGQCYTGLTGEFRYFSNRSDNIEKAIRLMKMRGRYSNIVRVDDDTPGAKELSSDVLKYVRNSRYTPVSNWYIATSLLTGRKYYLPNDTETMKELDIKRSGIFYSCKRPYHATFYNFYWESVNKEPEHLPYLTKDIVEEHKSIKRKRKWT